MGSAITQGPANARFLMRLAHASRRLRVEGIMVLLYLVALPLLSAAVARGAKVQSSPSCYGMRGMRLSN